MANLPIVIIGAGPVGLCTALYLAKFGLSSVLIEKRKTLHNIPRSAHFDDEVYRIYQAIGIKQQLSNYSNPIFGMKFVNHVYDSLLEFDKDPQGIGYGYAESNMVHQPYLERILRNAVSHCEKIDAKYNCLVSDIEQNGDGPIKVIMGDDDSNSTQKIECCYLLACDGAASSTRKFLDISMTDMGYHQQWFVVDILTDLKLDVERKVQQVCDLSRPYTFVPINDRMYRWEFMIPKGVDEELNDAYIEKRVAPWVNGVPYKIKRRATYTFHSLVAEKFRYGNVFLLGDAAHQTPPFLGQGLCAGIRDAQNLAWKLGLVDKGLADDKLLDSYYDERSQHVKKVIRRSILAGLIINPYHYVLRNTLNALIGLLSKIPFTKRNIAKSRVPDLHGILRRPSLGNHRLVGTMLPQPLIESGRGGLELLDDVVSGGFVYLAIDENAVLGIDKALTSSIREFVDCYLVVAQPCDSKVESVGAKTLFDVKGILVNLMEKHNLSGVFVRPDRFVCMVTRRDTSTYAAYVHEMEGLFSITGRDESPIDNLSVSAPMN